MGMTEHEYKEPMFEVLKRVEPYPDGWANWGVWRENPHDDGEGGEG